jgi:hypothetical protein
VPGFVDGAIDDLEGNREVGARLHASIDDRRTGFVHHQKHLLRDWNTVRTCSRVNRRRRDQAFETTEM